MDAATILFQMDSHLTDRQADVLTYLCGYLLKYGYQPSFRDMMGALGIGSPNGMSCHVGALHAKKFVRMAQGMNRKGRDRARALTLLRWPTGDEFSLTTADFALADMLEFLTDQLAGRGISL